LKYVYSFIGGIGDFLSCISAFENLKDLHDIEDVKIFLFSHYDDIEYLSINLPFEHECIIFSNNDDLKDKYEKFLATYKESFIEKIEPDLTNLHPDLSSYIPEECVNSSFKMIEKSCDILKQKDVDIVAVHLSGSKFSTSVLNAANKPNKFVPHSRIAELIRGVHSLRNNTMFYIFGSKDEEHIYDFIKERLPRKCTFPVFGSRIWTSLALARNCNAAVCSDSAIKTMTCIEKIPTVVFLGNYEDPIRDKVFIDPYVKEGFMQLVKFKKEIDSEDIEKAITKIVNILGSNR